MVLTARRVAQTHHGGLHLREAAAVGGDGPASARATLFYVHGLGESGLGFEGLLAAPALRDRRQLALDLPGYGKSPWPEQAHGLERHASTLARWLEHAHPEPVVVIGHSMGAVIGQLLCEGWPERVAGFCNVEGNISLPDCTYSGRANAEGEPEFSRRGFARLLDDVYAGGAADQALRHYYASLCQCDPRTFHRNAVELVALSEEETLAERLAALAVPACYIYGDPRGTGAASRALLAAHGLSPLAVEGAGHWPFVDQEERFLERLLAFLAAHG